MYLSSRTKVNIVLTSIIILSMSLALIVSVQIREAKAAQTSNQSDWPMFGYNQQHTHFNSNETIINPSNVSSLTTDWIASLPRSVVSESSPTVVNGVAYIGTVDGNNVGGGMFALNATNGQILWSYVNGSGFESSPVVFNGVVYVGAHYNDNKLYAFNANTGAVLWTSPQFKDSIDSSPTVLNGVVYVGGYDHNVYAFNADGCGSTTCSPLWTFTANDFVFSSPVVDSGFVYISTSATLYALDATTGAMKWTSTVGVGPSSPAVINGVVYAGDVNGSVYALNATTGAILWSAPTGSLISSSPAVANGVVYIGSYDHKLYAFNASSGTQLWTATTGDKIDISSPAVANGAVYIGSRDGYLYAFNANGCGSTTCSPLWSFNLADHYLYSSTAIANGVVYIGAQSLYAFYLPSITPTPSPSPSPSPSPTITMQKVWTADGTNKATTSFTPGDTIHYRAKVNNTNSTTVTASFTFLATGPRQIFSWSGSKSVASGTPTITTASTVPFDAPAGQYTLTVTVTYNGISSQGQGQFTVTRPYNSAINNLTTDANTDQSETTIAVSSVNSPGLTVMVAYNDLRSEETGYSYSFDGGTTWTDGGAPPVYQDSSGNGANGGDPALTVDKNGTFYLAQIEYTANLNEFIGMSKCNYVSSTGKIKCMRPVKVSDSIPICHPSTGGVSAPNDKPGITYDPVNNRVYITWTLFTFDTTGKCGVTSTEERLRYYNVSTGKFSFSYLLDFLAGNGTAPVVTSSGLVYVFFLQTTAQGLGQSIDYTTFNNGTVATYTLDNLYPAAQLQSACTQNHSATQEAFTTQAFANNHYARTNELPAAAVDKNGNIDVVWEGATSNGGISTIFVATLPSGGGTPTIQYLPNPTHLIQWQPAVAVAGGTNTLAVTYFQVVKTSSGYQIVREQVTAPASSVPTFGAAKMISTVSWNALPTNDTSNSTPCYEGDYSASVSIPTANVVWSYWGDNRNGSQADVYGLYTNVP